MVKRVYFTDSNANDIVNNPRDTTLTAFFKLRTEDDFAKTLTYDKVSGYYTWNQRNRKFHRRKQGIPVEGYNEIRKTEALGRVYVVHPNNCECFHLKMLLHVVKGRTSFKYLRTVEGTTYDTFQAACTAMGLLEDDSHWESTLSEAALYSSAKSLRYLFSILIAFCHVTNLLTLWSNHRESMSEDILHRKRRESGLEELNYDQDVFDKALIDVDKIVESLASKSIKDFGLPLPSNINLERNNSVYLREVSYDQSRLLQTVVQGSFYFGRSKNGLFLRIFFDVAIIDINMKLIGLNKYTLKIHEKYFFY